MKLLHDGAGVARILEAAAVKGEKGEERNYIVGSSPGYIVKRDEPPFLPGRRAGSVATIVEIYLQPKGVHESRRNNFDVRLSSSERSIALPFRHTHPRDVIYCL